LQKLLKSWDINLYTLLARDILNKKYPETITPKLSKEDLDHYNDQNPIHWAKIKKELFKPNTDLKSLAQDYKAQESIGVYSYILSKASHQREIYFPMPYQDLMSKFPKKRQAIIYAIARQESRFVPASVSRSFALGLMQIMPFLIEHIAKERGEKIDLDEIFNPKKAIIYANHHINYLAKYLHNPLFVAYAYNGGIGFTRRLIERSDYFRKGAYEPYLSIEKIDNVEAREYGKKVLVNYVIYLNKMGIQTRITPYIEELTIPSQTDSFRK
jgi:soluble lytic murein transglycosylase